MDQEHSTRQTRKTRIVCISDTHVQTPKLPKGDVLVHAGDLTNQGSYPELKKTVDWLEKADFEAKIVIAGNHDITLDTPFFEEYGSSWRWPGPQDSEACRKLLTESKSITYLENEAAAIFLQEPHGPHTCFKVYGSPCSPKESRWAFQYEPKDASQLWARIPSDADIVITHTPPKGHCDRATKDDRSGCEVLLRALHCVRPMLAICGHIHEARGVQRVQWSLQSPNLGSLVEDYEEWDDPGVGNNKQSLVNLTARGGRPLNNCSSLTRQSNSSEPPTRAVAERRGKADGVEIPQPYSQKSTSEGVGHNEATERAKAMPGGASVYCQGVALSDVGLGQKLQPDVEAGEGRKETVVINAAFLGPRISGKSMGFNKPIVVDVDLPVWGFEQKAE